MRQSDVIKILAAELGTGDIEALNKIFKAKDFNTKFRITGPQFVHYGFTGLIKSLTAEGVKIYNVNKVNLVRYEDIEGFAKAKPKDREKPKDKAKDNAKDAPSKNSVKPTPETKKNLSAKKMEDDEEDYDNDDDFDEDLDQADDVIEDKKFEPKFVMKKKKKNLINTSGSGSRFIPKKK